MKFGIDTNGNYGYIKAGADTVTHFSSVPKEILLVHNQSGLTFNVLVNSLNETSTGTPSTLIGNYIKCVWDNSNLFLI